MKKLFISLIILLLIITADCNGVTTPDDPSGDEFYLFDAHSHTIADIGGVATVEHLVDAGIRGVMIFGGDAATEPLQQLYPDFVYPFAQHTRDLTTRKLILNESLVDRFAERLTTCNVFGIGELSVRHRPFPGSPPDGDQNEAEHPILLEVYDLAAKHNVPMNVHFEHEYADELEGALEHNRDTIIIWAHVGDGPGSLVQDMMREHSNLYADISTRNPFYERGIPIEDQRLDDDNGTIKEEWKEVFEEFPDRFLFGLDFGPGNRYQLLCWLK